MDNKPNNFERLYKIIEYSFHVNKERVVPGDCRRLPKGRPSISARDGITANRKTNKTYSQNVETVVALR